MSWFKIDDGMHSHPKTLAAGNEAIGLWARCGSYCSQHLTEGRVPRAVALMYGDTNLIDTLVKVGLFTPFEGDWLIHDYHDYNPTREKVLAEREAAAERQRAARERAKLAREAAAKKAAEANGHASSHGDSHGVTNAVSHTDAEAHDSERHGVTRAHGGAHVDSAPQGTIGATSTVVQDAAGQSDSGDMSRRDSRQQSRAPRPDPTRPVLPTEVPTTEEPFLSPTASPPADEQQDAAEEPEAQQPPAVGKSKRTKKPEPQRDDVDALCGRLVELMTANECKPPAVGDDWLREARLLLDRDGRELDKALRVLEWSQQDHFWKKNIHSIPTFRRQYDKLRLAAIDDWERAHAPGGTVLPFQRPAPNDLGSDAHMQRFLDRQAARREAEQAGASQPNHDPLPWEVAR